MLPGLSLAKDQMKHQSFLFEDAVKFWIGHPKLRFQCILLRKCSVYWKVQYSKVEMSLPYLQAFFQTLQKLGLHHLSLFQICSKMLRSLWIMNKRFCLQVLAPSSGLLFKSWSISAGPETWKMTCNILSKKKLINALN